MRRLGAVIQVFLRSLVDTGIKNPDGQAIAAQVVLFPAVHSEAMSREGRTITRGAPHLFISFLECAWQHVHSYDFE